MTGKYTTKDITNESILQLKDIFQKHKSIYVSRHFVAAYKYQFIIKQFHQPNKILETKCNSNMDGEPKRPFACLLATETWSINMFNCNYEKESE